MAESENIKITLVGAGGMSFGPVMVSDIIHTPRLKGSTLSLMDVSEKRLDVAYKVAERMNDAMGRPVSIEAHTDLARSVIGADYAMISVEVNRWKGWDEDYDIPRKYGSTQIMGENGGPGGIFHALRTVSLVADICRKIERVNKDIFIINFTNPMGPVTLGVNRATKLRNVGLCHEFAGGVLFMRLNLRIPRKKIAARAAGTNHFTWFYEIKHADTGKDLYPKVKRHFERYPFLHMPLARYCLKRYGLLSTTSDEHFGEYLPFAEGMAHSARFMRGVYKMDCRVREALCRRYAAGRFRLPVKRIPRSHEEAIPIVEAMALGRNKRFNAVNVPNRGYIPNLPDGMIVEVGASVEEGEILPDTVPPVQEELANFMRTVGEIQDKTVEAALKGDPDLAFEAILAEQNSPPDRDDCRRMFDEMVELQKDLLPF